MPIAITVSCQDQENLVRLVVSYGQVQESFRVEHGKQLSLYCKEKQVHLQGLMTICKYIAYLSPKVGQLLGEDDATRAQVAQWLSYRNTSLIPITEDKMLKISTLLAPKTFIVQNSVSIADLCLYAALQRPVTALPPAQLHRYCNLVRWLDHVQHIAGDPRLLPLVEIPKPGPPLPPQGLAKAVEPKAKEPVSAPALTNSAKFATKAPTEIKEANTVGLSAAANAPATLPPDSSLPSANGSYHQMESNSIVILLLQDEKKAKREARKEGRREAEPKSQVEEVRIDMLDIRVGTIVEIKPHPNADALYIEQIDVGEEKPRQVVSGLRNFVALDALLNRKVAICLNLKPAKMRETMSYGMVLCASNKVRDAVDPLLPPDSAINGEKIKAEGYDNEPIAEINPKKKILEKLKEDLRTDSSGVATFKDVRLRCAKGPITSSISAGFVG